jgi:hypothetical protein
MCRGLVRHLNCADTVQHTTFHVLGHVVFKEHDRAAILRRPALLGSHRQA